MLRASYLHASEIESAERMRRLKNSGRLAHCPTRLRDGDAGRDRADPGDSSWRRGRTRRAWNRSGRTDDRVRGARGVTRNAMDTLWLTPAIVCYALSAALFVFDRVVGPRARDRLRGRDCSAPARFSMRFDLTARGLQAGNIPVANLCPGAVVSRVADGAGRAGDDRAAAAWR